MNKINFEVKLHSKSIDLWQQSLKPSDRVLISGASGWFGQTAMALCIANGIETFAVTRNKISNLEPHVIVHDWDDKKIQDFRPTVVIDCAFQTREKLSTMSLDEYVKQNRMLTERLLWLSTLESVRLAITVSSGAAVYPNDSKLSSIDKNPYGFLKREAELRLALVASQRGIATVIPRAWSVSGAYCSKPQVFAFTNLISQAFSGSIQINANTEVFRRYTSVEDLLAVSVAAGIENSNTVIDSGGELIEIYSLAEKITRLINPEAQISRNLNNSGHADKYYSDGIVWQQICESLDFSPENLDNQILRVANTIEEYC